MTEEECREMARNNYAAQMEMRIMDRRMIGSAQKVKESEMGMTTQIRECKQNNLCADCNDKKCWFAGQLIADCPLWQCNRQGELYEDCKS